MLSLGTRIHMVELQCNHQSQKDIELNLSRKSTMDCILIIKALKFKEFGVNLNAERLVHNFKLVRVSINNKHPEMFMNGVIALNDNSQCNLKC